MEHKNSLSEGKRRFLIGNTFFIFFIEGVFVILIGSILPMMMNEYGLSYQVSGVMISAHNIGQMITGFLAGVFAIKFGLKKSMMGFLAIVFVGFAVTLFTGNPLILITALLMTGLGRGGISNYSNQIMSESSENSAALLNALHACFAIGAVLSPVVTLVCTKGNPSGWRTTIYLLTILGLIVLVTTSRMDMSKVSIAKASEEKPSFAFLKEKVYLMTMAIAFCYLCVEGTLMGWMVKYFTDTGVVSENFTQILTSILWISILIGRFACTGMGTKLVPAKMIRMLSCGMVVFLALVVISNSFVLVLVSTIGLGLSMSGMYATTVANAGDVFARYPMAMSIYVTVTSLGSVITPSIVGVVSEDMGIRVGMGILLIPCVILLLLTIVNAAGRKAK